jgi:hypothetical protein
MSNWRPELEIFFFSCFCINSDSYEYKTDPLTTGTIRTYGNSNRLLEDLSSNSYINIVYEEFQHLFNFNFGVLVRGIRVIFNKVMFLVTDHKIWIFPFIIFAKETVVNDVKKSRFQFIMRNGSVKGRKVICFYAIWERFCDFRFARSSLEFLKIHIWFTPLLEYVVAQYVWSFSFRAVKMLVRSKDKGLV